jgi:FhuF 2Fe-2S C-terminal domain
LGIIDQILLNDHCLTGTDISWDLITRIKFTRVLPSTFLPRSNIISSKWFHPQQKSSSLINQSLDADDLLGVLRQELEQQATPVVDALYDWSGFARKGSWGMITSSWAAQFITVCGLLSQQMNALPFLLKLFEGKDEIAKMKPLLHPVTLRGVTHLYQRRASCCRYYLLPKGDPCASCPLASNEERLKRNKEWMEVQLNRAVQRPLESSTKQS